MPRCWRAREPDQDTQDEWREPPGYLGEAVRRAKRIPSLSLNKPAPPRRPEGLPPSP